MSRFSSVADLLVRQCEGATMRTFCATMMLMVGACSPGSHLLLSEDGGGPADADHLSDPPWIDLVADGVHQFGVSLAFGDLDGDGYDEIILTDHRQRDAEIGGPFGAILIVHGRAERLATPFDLDDAVEVI